MKDDLVVDGYSQQNVKKNKKKNGKKDRVEDRIRAFSMVTLFSTTNCLISLTTLILLHKSGSNCR